MSNFTVKDQNSDHKYFSILQNILSMIGLSAYERSLYWAIKECAGEKGSCTKSYDNLAKMSGMGVTKLKGVLASLAKPNDYIKKPLIYIIDRRRDSKTWDTKEIILECLWDDNIKFCKNKNNQSPRDPPPSPHDSPQSPRDPGVSRHATGGESPRDYKEEPYKKNPIKTTPPTSSKKGAVAADFNKILLDVIAHCKKKNFPFSEAKIYQLANEYKNALIDILNLYSKKTDYQKEQIKSPDGWLTTETRKQHELLQIKKDYEI